MSNNKDILTPLTFLTYSLGCRTNQAEIEKINLQLSANSFIPFNLCCFDALKLCCYPTVVLFNTCVVTQKAEKETRQKINELRRKYPKSFLVVMGCAVTTKEKYKINLPEVNLFIPNSQKKLALKKIIKYLKIKNDTLIHDRKLLRHFNKYQLSGRKFIKIQDGCDKFCSFCITCLIRGKPTSVPSQEIIKEINFWDEREIKEIILTGINLSLYSFERSDLQGGQTSLVDLVKEILKETKIERLSFSSIYPEMLTENFLKIVVGNPRTTQCFHLSLQSGSPSVLERMNRKTNLDKLLKQIEKIRKINPYFTFRADIITGFPDETDEEFQETLNFIQKAKISFIHSFLFSMRPHTKMEGLIKSEKYHEIENLIKKQRAEMLKKAVEEIRNNEAEKMIAQLFNCLIVRRNNDEWEGITENGWPVLAEQHSNIATEQHSLKGKIVRVRITDYKNNQLLGEIVSLPTN